jgi:hypothetical protein
VSVRWKKLNNYCIEYDKYIICKYKTQDEFRFILWSDDKLIKVFNTAQEAKDETMALNRTESSISS